ncbi:MAG: AzlC family ABC transporter permease [Rhizobiaceae bacterium]
MIADSPSSDFLAGAKRAVPVILSAMPFALLFGALAADNGLSTGQIILMSASIYAGASQMVGIELFGQHAAPWLIAFSIFVVNLRHLLYSATTGRHLGRFTFWQKAAAFFFLIDPQFAETEREAAKGNPITPAWYFGMGLAIYATWLAETWIGAVFGNLIANPRALGLDMLLSVYFLGLVMGFRARPNWLPVVVVSALAAVLALKFVGSPWHVSLGALAGVVYAAFAAEVKR